MEQQVKMDREIPSTAHYHVFMCVCVCADNKNIYFSVYRFAKRLQCVYISLNMPLCACLCTISKHTHTHRVRQVVHIMVMNAKQESMPQGNESTKAELFTMTSRPVCLLVCAHKCVHR